MIIFPVCGNAKSWFGLLQDVQAGDWHATTIFNFFFGLTLADTTWLRNIEGSVMILKVFLSLNGFLKYMSSTSPGRISSGPCGFGGVQDPKRGYLKMIYVVRLNNILYLHTYMYSPATEELKTTLLWMSPMAFGSKLISKLPFCFGGSDTLLER